MRLAALALLSCVSACAPEVAAPPVSPAGGFHAASEPVRLDVVLEDHLGWPYRLERLLVVLDGTVVHNDAAPGERVISVAHLSGVPEGDHMLQVLAKVSYTSGSFDDECVATLKTARSFTATGRAMRIRLDLFASDVTRPFGERVRMDARAFGSYGDALDCD